MVVRLLLLLATLALAAPAAAADLLLEAEATPARPYVQQEVRYTVRLYRQSSLDTGYFVDPEVPGAVALLLGEDDPVRVRRDGGEWQMIERRYLLFPQRSGPLPVPAPVFSGRQVFVEGDPLTLAVRPKPAQAGANWWLPARGFGLEQEWRLPDPPLRPGEAIQRIVTLTAEGLTGAQLPSLATPPGAGYRVRRARSRSDHEVSNETVRGRRIEHLVIVPEQPGELALPPVVVNWWDTAADRPRQATLPGRRLQVAGTATSRLTDRAANPRLAKPVTGQSTDLLPVLAAALTLGLLGVLAWAGGRLADHPAWIARRSRTIALQALTRACHAGDPAAARDALRAWAAARWPGSPPRLAELPRRLDAPDLAEPMRRLDRAVYGPAGHDWDGPALARRLLPLLRQARPVPGGGRTAEALPPLSP